VFRSYEDIREFVGRFSYKPNYKITSWIDTSYIRPRLFLNMVVTVPDVVTPGHPDTQIAFTQTYGLDDLMLSGPQYAFHMMERFVEDWERHEAAEWLCFDGKKMHDPHVEPKGIRNASL
jgi:hypothetical protein